MSNLPPLKLTEKPDLLSIATHINHIQEGASNAIGTVTLTNGATSTTLTDGHIKPTSVILMFPQTADAAAVTGLYPDMTSVPMIGGKVTLNHSSIGSADCTFGYVVLT